MSESAPSPDSRDEALYVREHGHVSPSAPPPSAGKLFVGQVPAVCTEDMLRPVFAPFGSIIEIKIMRDSPGGRSKGCAWVKYTTREEAQSAIDALHERHTIPPQTNTLQVRFAEEKPKQQQQQQQQMALTMTDTAATTHSSPTAFVGNLPPDTAPEDLRDFIAPILPQDVSLKDVNVPTGKLFGFLSFESASDCETALRHLTSIPLMFQSNQLRIQPARPRGVREMSYPRSGFAPPIDPASMFYGGRTPAYTPPFGGFPMMTPYGMGMGPSPFPYPGIMPNPYTGGGLSPPGSGRGRGRNSYNH